MAFSQLSISIWSWQFSIFLEGFLEPWQMGIIFSTATFLGVLAGYFTGFIGDLLGRRWSVAIGFIPVAVGLTLLSFIPFWPLVIMQYGLVWFGMMSVRITGSAIPADEVSAEGNQNPARKLMVVMMPLWFFDALGPLTGSFLLSLGYQSDTLHRIGAIVAIFAFFSAILLIKESLSSDIIDKARQGPKVSFRQLGREFWLMVVGMVGFSFAWNLSIRYIGNLSVGPWGVDEITYGLTWTAFSLMSALIMYPASKLADKNLRGTLLAAVIGNGLVFLWFAYGSGAPMLYLLNIVWAIPFVLWNGSEKGILVLCVSDEVKGRALGTYRSIMAGTGILGQVIGATIWELSDNIRLVWQTAGIWMLMTSVVLFFILRQISTSEKATNEKSLPQ
jgi:MFS family permease